MKAVNPLSTVSGPLKGRGLALFDCLRRMLNRAPPVKSGFDAAVAVVLTRCPDLRVVMIERTRRPDDPWGGDMAFPGGRRENSESPLETALRELEEEACIDPREVEVLGYMDTVSPKTVRMTVVPVVAYYRKGCPRRRCVGPETARVALVPVPVTLEVREILHPARGIVVEGFKDWYGNVVWGMSLRILARLHVLLSACGLKVLE